MVNGSKQLRIPRNIDLIKFYVIDRIPCFRLSLSLGTIKYISDLSKPSGLYYKGFTPYDKEVVTLVEVTIYICFDVFVHFTQFTP